MRINKNYFKRFTHEEAVEWGKENFNDLLPQLHNQDYSPTTPVEMFFRNYTQGIHYAFNRILRFSSIEKHDFEDDCVSKEMLVDGIAEINQHKLNEDIVVYRYISKAILKKMKEISHVRIIRRNVILRDMGFLSTTLSLNSVKDRGYANLKNSSLFTIYVPKGTPCVYVDLVSNMRENELLFATNVKLKIMSNRRLGRSIECTILN